MDAKKQFLKALNHDYFELAQNKLKSKFYSRKHLIFEKNIEIKSPCIYICNKTTDFDSFFVSNTLVGDFVFLKDDIISKIRNGSLSKKEETSLLKEFENLSKNNFSIVIFPEKNITLFGKCEELPKSVTEFLYQTNLDLKFLYLINTYFTKPVWSSSIRKCEAKFSQQFGVTHDTLSTMSESERNDKINHLMPSSASNYAAKFKPIIRSNKLAEDLETIMYCCPNCGRFFSLYSEFNCIKCRECLTAIELTKDGRILFSNAISSYDDIEDFLFNKLKQRNFDISSLIKYNDILFNEITDVKKQEKPQVVNIDIYADNVQIKNDTLNKKIKISDIKDITLKQNNCLHIYLAKETFVLQGKNKQNLYILLDLLKLHKSA